MVQFVQIMSMRLRTAIATVALAAAAVALLPVAAPAAAPVSQGTLVFAFHPF